MEIGTVKKMMIIMTKKVKYLNLLFHGMFKFGTNYKLSETYKFVWMNFLYMMNFLYFLPSFSIGKKLQETYIPFLWFFFIGIHHSMTIITFLINKYLWLGGGGSMKSTKSNKRRKRTRKTRVAG